MDKEFFNKHYIEKNMTMAEIAKITGRSVSWVYEKIRSFDIPTRSTGKSTVNMTKMNFGKLTVVEMVNQKGRMCCRCECDCGNFVVVRPSHLRAGGYTSCGCSRGKKKSQNKSWRGCGEISGFMWRGIYNTFKKSKKVKEFNITLSYAWELYESQNGLCALSGIPIVFSKTNEGHKRGETTASLDRIDSSKWYVEGNVQWVHKDVNKLKSNFSEEKLIQLCVAIARHSGRNSIKCT